MHTSVVMNHHGLGSRVGDGGEAWYMGKVRGVKQGPKLGCIGSNNISLVLCFFLLVVEDDCWSA